jgi:phosphoribosyl-AMP cyclohydrolase
MSDIETTTALSPRLNDQGLMPAIAQDRASGRVLMLAWMNAESLRVTLETGYATYWSRSRQKLWKKGEESGHLQKLVEARIDCDQDCLLLIVDQHGPACHTGAADCFYRRVDGAALVQAPR